MKAIYQRPDFVRESTFTTYELEFQISGCFMHIWPFYSNVSKYGKTSACSTKLITKIAKKSSNFGANPIYKNRSVGLKFGQISYIFCMVVNISQDFENILKWSKNLIGLATNYCF